MQRDVDGLKGAKTLCLNECGESIYRLPCLGPALVVCGCKVLAIMHYWGEFFVRCKILLDMEVWKSGARLGMEIAIIHVTRKRRQHEMLKVIFLMFKSYF